MDKCREQFEQWANDGFTGTLGRDLEGDYRNHFIQCQWEGWQAAWQAATEQASQPQDELVANMAMLMRRLLHSPDNTLLQSKVREFLRRNNLEGSPLR